MIHHYQDYYWKSGKPYGKGIVDPAVTPKSYKIVIDPYFRRFSVEKYHFNAFEKIIYDSALLDFRHLKPIDQIAWQQETASDAANSRKCLMRNQDDRVILVESYQFEQGRCRSCQLLSAHGIWLSTHRLYYTELGDPFNGVVLYDIEERPVVIKKYDIDPDTKDFNELIHEEWNMENVSRVHH